MQNKDIIQQYINLGQVIPKTQSDKLSEVQRARYVKKATIGIEAKISTRYNLSDEEFEFCQDELKKQYIEKRISEKYDITNKQFEWCSDELKLKYIEMIFLLQFQLNDEKFKLCSDELKLKYI